MLQIKKKTNKQYPSSIKRAAFPQVSLELHGTKEISTASECWWPLTSDLPNKQEDNGSLDLGQVCELTTFECFLFVNDLDFTFSRQLIGSGLFS